MRSKAPVEDLSTGPVGRAALAWHSRGRLPDTRGVLGSVITARPSFPSIPALAWDGQVWDDIVSGWTSGAAGNGASPDTALWAQRTRLRSRAQRADPPALPARVRAGTRLLRANWVKTAGLHCF